MATSGIVIALFAAAGCDGVLHLERVSDPKRDAAGSDGDGSMTDAPVGCTPSAFTIETQLVATNLESQAIAQNMDVGIVIDTGGSIRSVQPVESGTDVPTGIAGTTWIEATLQPTLAVGSSLFVFNTSTGVVDELGYAGPTLGNWSFPMPTDLPGGSGPGTPAEVNGGLRMVVALNGGFDEYMRMPGFVNWIEVPGSALTPSDLGHAGAVLSFPALTPDGLDLVYNDYEMPGSPGIYFLHRDHVSDRFTGAPTLLYAGIFNSPVLTADCSAVFAVDSAATTLVKLHN